MERFLGGYSAKAAESAVAYALSEENSPQFKRARHKLATKLLEKPISELVRHTRGGSGSFFRASRTILRPIP